MVEAPVQPVFSSESAAHELPAERPVRISGFLALGLGVLSGCAVFSKAFLPLAVLTVLVAAFALRPSRRGVPVGRWAARAGAVLAIFFGSWGWFQAATREEVLQQQAIRFAEDWLGTLQQGKSELALELASPPSARQSEKMSLEIYYQGSESGQEKLRNFLERPVVSDVLTGGKSLHWQATESPIVVQQRDTDEVTVRMKETTGMIGDVVQITLRREPADQEHGGQVEWTVDNFQYHYD